MRITYFKLVMGILNDFAIQMNYADTRRTIAASLYHLEIQFLLGILYQKEISYFNYNFLINSTEI